jgi:hypothetical protein
MLQTNIKKNILEYFFGIITIVIYLGIYNRV